MKKTISFRLFFTVLGRGICQVLRYVGKLFGYKDDSSYAKVLWRVSATCFTILLTLFTGCLLYALVIEVVIPKWIASSWNPEWNSQYISNHILFQKELWSNKTRIYNQVTRHTMLEDVDWVVISEDHDSLAVFSKDGKRGYLNRFTGEVVIPAIYSKAWVFSEGLAAVEKSGKLLFIDHSGQMVINKDFEIHPDMPAYIFKDGYCLMKNPLNGNLGLIDRKGEWRLPPEYLDIHKTDSLWIVETFDDKQAVMDNDINVILPFSHADYYVKDNAIFATLSDHTIRQYDLRGNLIEPFYIQEVEQMTYETGELRYVTTPKHNEAGQEEDEINSYPVNIQATARCRRYQAGHGWYGLMASNGEVLTPPAYSSISAIGKDLYLCKDDNGNGLLINGKGEKL
ncbi:MAG: WG repeat-containing protein [Bacteroidaceae bacterium]